MSISGVDVLRDLYWLRDQSELRCIVDAVKWANELIFYAPQEWHKAHEIDASSSNLHKEELPRSATVVARANFGRALMMSGEHYRAAFFLQQIKDQSPYDRFLYYWARYLAYEKNRLENEADAVDRRTEFDNSEMDSLHAELCTLGNTDPDTFDVFLFYVLGKVRLSLKLPIKAKAAFTLSVLSNRAFWPSWQELVNLTSSVDQESEEYADPKYWMFKMFNAGVRFRFESFKPAMDEYCAIGEAGFGDMPFIISQTAVLFNEMQEHDLALEMFEKAHKKDPYWVDNVHLYSDSLFVRGMQSELANLTHSFYRTHKFTWQVCCVVANYYSMRGDHEKAVVFLQRSLKLNPYNAFVWTLIGHELMEQKNISAACLAYRKAVQGAPSGYRGWYGLGQLYDILKMPSYSLYYYQQAHKCRSEDSRMLVALGEVYMRLNRVGDAQKCLLKAYKVGDVEGTALMLLGKLYEKEKNEASAASAYDKYLEVYAEDNLNDDDSMAYCCSYLAKHHFSRGNVSAAGQYAQRCLQYDSSKEEGRSILRQISALGAKPMVSSDHVVTSTPADRDDHTMRISNATPISPVLPQINISNSSMVYRTPTIPEGGEDMAITSEEDDSEEEDY